MRRIHRVLPLFLFLSIAVFSVRPAGAAGYLIVNGAGDPAAWASSPIPFNPDLGLLGTMDNATAVANVTSNFGVWDAVATSTATFTNAGALPVDVTTSNVDTYVGVCGDSLSPIVFDVDGSITDSFFGTGASNSVLGFAGPDCVTFVPSEITEGSAVLNGKFLDGINTPSNPEITIAEFNGVFVHEFGHYINLDHSQINLIEAFDGNSMNNGDIATMFPLLIDGSEFATLHLDDEVSASNLYPEAAFSTGFGTITGQILRSNGITPFQGAYVIARLIGDERTTAVGNASGARYFPLEAGGPPAPMLEGFYELPGLPAGSYTVEVEEINSSFDGGSSIGPIDPPVSLPGPAEFYNGVSEGSVNPPDVPSLATPVVVVAGVTTSGIDIILNSLCPAVASGTCLTAGKQLILVKEDVDPSKDKFTWKWGVGADTIPGDFGDPSGGSTALALCIYDETGGVPSLAAELFVPAGGTCDGRPCWNPTSTGFKYKDKNLSADGVKLISLKAGTGGAAKIIVKGKGTNRPSILPLDQDTNVIVQLVRSDSATCFETTFTSPPSSEDTGLFKDKD